MRVRRVGAALILVLATSSCSVPNAESLSCGEDQSIFACKAMFSDGKARSIVFVKFPSPDQSILDSVTTRDDVGNLYCVTLYDNVTATYVPGECGSTPPSVTQLMEPTSTSVDPLAKPQGVACSEGGPVEDCRVAYNDGTTRKVDFVDEVPDDFVKLDSDPHVDGNGIEYCVTAYGRAEEARATYVVGTEGC